MVCSTCYCCIQPSVSHFAFYCGSFFALCLYHPLLRSFGAENPRIQLGAAAAAPAAGCDAHAALCCRLAVAVGKLQPLAVGLALRAFRPVVDAACRGSRGRLRGDGAQQVVPLPQEIAIGAQTKAAFAQHHARAAGLGWPGAVVVLQLRQVSCISFCDELLGGKKKGRHYYLAIVIGYRYFSSKIASLTAPGTGAASFWRAFQRYIFGMEGDRSRCRLRYLWLIRSQRKSSCEPGISCIRINISQVLIELVFPLS